MRGEAGGWLLSRLFPAKPPERSRLAGPGAGPSNGWAERGVGGCSSQLPGFSSPELAYHRRIGSNCICWRLHGCDSTERLHRRRGEWLLGPANGQPIVLANSRIDARLRLLVCRGQKWRHGDGRHGAMIVMPLLPRPHGRLCRLCGGRRGAGGRARGGPLRGSMCVAAESQAETCRDVWCVLSEGGVPGFAAPAARKAGTQLPHRPRCLPRPRCWAWHRAAPRLWVWRPAARLPALPRRKISILSTVSKALSAACKKLCMPGGGAGHAQHTGGGTTALVLGLGALFP